MSWASRRQSQYIFGILAIVAVVIFIMIYPSISKAPSCTDGKQNGGELGVDCGGSCSRLCASQVSEPIILWSRGFNIVGSNYNLVALVQNQNKGAAVAKASYEFRVYDTQNRLIGRRDGVTFIPPNGEFAVFEPRFDAGAQEIKSVTFEFTDENLAWVKKAPTIQTLPIRIGTVILENDTQTLTAQVMNDSIYDLPSFDVVAILYDANHTALTVSKTHSDGLRANLHEGVQFSWPKAFSATVATQDLLLQVDPFSTSF